MSKTKKAPDKAAETVKEKPELSPIEFSTKTGLAEKSAGNVIDSVYAIEEANLMKE